MDTSAVHAGSLREKKMKTLTLSVPVITVTPILPILAPAIVRSM
jgi:hypothetical protein